MNTRRMSDGLTRIIDTETAARWDRQIEAHQAKHRGHVFSCALGDDACFCVRCGISEEHYEDTTLPCAETDYD